MTDFNDNVPVYKVEENDKNIYIEIVAPLSKPKEAAFLLEHNVLTFDSPPYLLKIKLPHTVFHRSGKQAFDNEKKTYKIKLKKSHFDTVIEESSDDGTEEIFMPIIFSNGENMSVKSSVNAQKIQFYGFANKYSNMFGKLYEEFSDVVNLPDPDHTDPSERRIFRIKEENEKWDDDHYLADTMETDHLETIFEYKPPWIESFKDDYNEDEKEILSELIDEKKMLNLPAATKTICECQLVDILFAFCYNKRTTEGDNTVESGWTINKLSATLSWFEVFENFKFVLLSCYRRSLTFPLYRNWNLSQMIQKDVVHILELGPKQVTRCLLEVRDIFNECENRYLLNSLYINDMCNFSHCLTTERCLELSKEVDQVTITKYEVNNDLPLLEVAAHLTLEEETKDSFETESKVKSLMNKIAGLELENESDASSDYSESDSEDSEAS